MFWSVIDTMYKTDGSFNVMGCGFSHWYLTKVICLIGTNEIYHFHFNNVNSIFNWKLKTKTSLKMHKYWAKTIELKAMRRVLGNYNFPFYQCEAKMNDAQARARASMYSFCSSCRLAILDIYSKLNWKKLLKWHSFYH